MERGYNSLNPLVLPPLPVFICSTIFITELKILKLSVAQPMSLYPRYLNNNILLKLLFFFWEHSYHTYYI